MQDDQFAAATSAGSTASENSEDAATARPGRASRAWSYGLRVAVAIALLAWVFYTWPPGELAAELAKVDPLFLGAALLCIPVKLWFETRRWYRLAKLIEPQATMSRACASVLVGTAAGMITPGGHGAHIRVAFFPNASKTQLAAVSVWDWVAHGAVVAVVGVVALCVLPLAPYGEELDLPHWASSSLIAAVAVAAAIQLVLLLMVVMPRTMLKLVAWVPWIARRHIFADVRTALHLLDTRTRCTLLWLSLGTFLVYLVQFLFVLRGLGFDHRHAWAAITASILIRNVLSISIGGLGVREITTAGVLKPLGATPATAVTGSLVMFVLNCILPSLAGAVVMALMRNRPNNTTTHETQT